MAFSKNQAGLGMKIMIVAICIIMVVTICLPLLSSVFGSSSSSASSSSDSSSTETSSSSETSSTSSYASASEVDEAYGVIVEAAQTKIDDDPTDTTLYEDLGNDYFDWAVQLFDFYDEDGVEDEISEIWAKAIAAYDTFLEDNTSSAVTVDRAIAIYYNGDTDTAIEALETFTAETDDYPPAWANLGLFYESNGDTDKAKEAYQKALDTDPDDEYGNEEFVTAQLEGLED